MCILLNPSGNPGVCVCVMTDVVETCGEPKSLWQQQHQLHCLKAIARTHTQTHTRTHFYR